ncbi:MAG: histidine kinase dimerization/phospho-acceptor domain-containing protein [Caldilineaceae bacterium]
MTIFDGVLLDVTERKELEEQFRQTQKMDALGRLAGGIAHDFNNTLVPIIGYTDMAMMKLPPTDRLYGFLEQVQTATMRAADITRQILAF